jgi:amidophosphoribosyltransferase
MNFPINGLREECGVFGVFGSRDASALTYYGLHALQHRGQEACGIVAAQGSEFTCLKGEGLVADIFNEKNIAALHGSSAIGHVRYSTTGGSGMENVQPFLFRHNTGAFALAHNGNLVNSKEIAKYLEDNGSLFQSTSDSELLAHLIKKERSHAARLRSIVEALHIIEGAFAFLIMTDDKLYACRDKYGLRPLSIGMLHDAYIVSSETCALDAVGASFLRDIAPGEVAAFSSEGIERVDYSAFKQHRLCAMEYIYFARPDSDLEGCNVHLFRKESGKLLYQQAPAAADIVIGVPDSSISAAIGYAEASGIPYEMGLIKNKYVGRTFIEPSQALRERGVRMKLSAVRSIVRGKRVVLIDDSVVRGTTSRRIVTLLRDAGAAAIHVRIASPPLVSPCYYGVNISTYEELISANQDVECVRRTIGADSLAFLHCDSLYAASSRSELCTACFTGNYPTALYQNANHS